MGLPFKPEPIEKLRERYPAAIKDVFDAREGTPSPRPGELRANVFDFHEGLRLIISMDRVQDDITLLHLSARPEKAIALYPDHSFRRIAIESFVVISGDHGMWTFIRKTGGGVYHWVREIS